MSDQTTEGPLGAIRVVLDEDTLREAAGIAQVASAARQFAAHYGEFAADYPEGWRESFSCLLDAVQEFNALTGANERSQDRELVREALQGLAEHLEGLVSLWEPHTPGRVRYEAVIPHLRLAIRLLEEV